jgi:hypothetical protein
MYECVKYILSDTDISSDEIYEVEQLKIKINIGGSINEIINNTIQAIKELNFLSKEIYNNETIKKLINNIYTIKSKIFIKLNKYNYYKQLNINIDNLDIFSLFSLIDNNNASTLIGSLEATDNIQTIVYNKSFSTCVFNKDIYNEFEEIKQLKAVKINTGITKLYNKKIDNEDEYKEELFLKKYMKYKSKYLLLKNEMIKNKN